MEGIGHFPVLSGYALASAAWYAVSLCCHKGTLLNHVQPVVLQHPWVFCKVVFSPVSAHPVVLHGVITYQVQGSCQPIHWPANVLDRQGLRDGESKQLLKLNSLHIQVGRNANL